MNFRIFAILFLNCYSVLYSCVNLTDAVYVPSADPSSDPSCDYLMPLLPVVHSNYILPLQLLMQSTIAPRSEQTTIPTETLDPTTCPTTEPTASPSSKPTTCQTSASLSTNPTSSLSTKPTSSPTTIEPTHDSLLVSE